MSAKERKRKSAKERIAKRAQMSAKERFSVIMQTTRFETTRFGNSRNYLNCRPAFCGVAQIPAKFAATFLRNKNQENSPTSFCRCAGRKHFCQRPKFVGKPRKTRQTELHRNSGSKIKKVQRLIQCVSTSPAFFQTPTRPRLE